MIDNAHPTAEFRVICADLPAPPLFWRDDTVPPWLRVRPGQAAGAHTWPAVSVRVSKLGGFLSRAAGREGDVILCGQGISAHRKTLADFTEPYAVFDEAVMIRRGANLRSASDLVGKKVGAIAQSLNMALAETFTGCICVPFGGDSDDVLGDMVTALRDGKIDAFVDDDVALVPLAEEPDLEIGFSVPTQNKWGIAIKKAMTSGSRTSMRP
jgi:polar amino acid transport system substrate-binding protein